MAEKLKGLLDRANSVLGGLLGDFPQGFNAGAVAGVPGWLGDMAYMTDTARLALTGADSKIPAAEFPGTTEYIASRAGYPVPQSLSGQLGAAVGGLMSPGPGDLARFGPVAAMFLGAKARTAMPDVLEYAQAMDKAGKSADEIWQTTAKLGQPWFKGADGKWRFEVDDSTASLIPSAFDSKLGDVRAEAPDALVHPDLWNAYSAEDIAPGGITLYPRAGSTLGQYSGGLVQVGTDPETFGKIASGKPLTYEMTGEASTVLHELQHAIQQREGFGKGGNPNQAFRDSRMWGKDASSGSDVARKMLTDKLAEMRQVMPLEQYAKAAWGSDVVTKEIAEDYARNYVPTVAKPLSPDMERVAQETISKEWYKRLAGEAEARNVQSRMNMTMDERIALPPWLTQDVPTDQQIVRFGDGPAMSEPLKAPTLPTPDDWLDGDGVPGYGLHITDAPNGAKISKEGIKAGKDGYSYLWDRGMDAEAEAFMRDARISRNPNMNWDEAGAIADDYVIVDTSKLQTETDPMTGALRVKGDIPPSAIVNPKSEPLKAAEDFASRRAGKPKPYREAMGAEKARTLQDVVSQYEAQGLNMSAYQNAANPDVITLSRIQVPEAQRGQGIGSQAMADLVSYADEHGKTVALSPSSDFGGNVNRLREFYKRFGFIDNKGRTRDLELSESMYRKPRAN